MKIQNYDVDVAVARKAIACVPFIMDVIRVCQPCPINSEECLCSKENNSPQPKLPCEPIWKLHTHSYDDVANMIHQIPIYLCTGQGNIEANEDVLGAYYSRQKTESPYIKIFVNKIEEDAKDIKKFKWLFTVVLLHEVMHAIMDVMNQSGYTGNEAQMKKDYRLCREESYANAGALWIIRKYAQTTGLSNDKRFAQYAEKFMKKQGKGYSLGVEVADFPIRYMYYWIQEKMTGKVNANEKEKWDNNQIIR